MGANGNINDLELAKFIELAGQYGIRVHILHGDNWAPAVADVASLPATGNVEGDIRQVLDTGTPYRWNGSTWTVWSTSGVSWGGIAGTLSDQTDLKNALDAKMGAGAYVLVNRESLLTNQINLGSLTSGILKQTVSAGVATISILTDNSGNWNTAYTHSQTTGNPHGTTKSDVGLGNVDNTSDVNKPVSTAQQTALNLKQDTSGKDATGGYVGLTLFKINFKNVANTFTSFFTNSNTAARTYTFQDRDGTIVDDTDLALKAPIASPTFTGTVTVPTPVNATDAVTKSYADGLVAGLLDYRGGYNASSNTYPTTGGSGTASAVVKGDMWIISVAGTLSGTAVQVGDSLVANIDSPGQTQANWNILNSNISYVPEDVANKATTMTGNTASNTVYLTAKAIYDWITTALLGSLTVKTTPVNVDGVPIMDSEASNVMKFLSFTNLKAFLKTYFDTIYAQVAGSLSQVFSVSSLEIGNTDTTMTRVSAGVVAIEGNNIITSNITSSTSQSGIVELATTAEINTGTDSTRAMPVDQFVASTRNVRYIDIYAIEKATDNAVGTNIAGAIECPFTGTITEIGAYVETAGVTGASVWDVNKNGTTIMTTNKLSIDSAEVSTRTAATAPTLTTTAITAGDLITIDTDSLSTTKPKGLHVRIGIRLS